ncbi:MAG: response regulator [Chitinophagaceae bacterium]
MGDRIIIFDDDQDILLVTAAILQRRGYEVMCRENCLTMDTDLQTFAPQVILMDNWMPDISGVQAVQHIKRNPAFKAIPVIFFTANSNVEALATEAGADYLLKKPFDIAGLQEMIAVALK